ncbi:unnamed protein product [Ceratitis capitata]|uniref:(Mediterranean fruit fly) hypothetical protein n=1 Tax=Ceratitis capitata TaxID=7213 RepID=A0A811VBV4_CERCA|nr:unnamed protein product [Ceratitis capitata]
MTLAARMALVSRHRHSHICSQPKRANDNISVYVVVVAVNVNIINIDNNNSGDVLCLPARLLLGWLAWLVGLLVLVLPTSSPPPPHGWLLSPLPISYTPLRLLQLPLYRFICYILSVG